MIKCHITASTGCCSIQDFKNFLTKVQPKRILCGTKCFKYISGHVQMHPSILVEPQLTPGTFYDIEPKDSNSSFFTGKVQTSVLKNINFVDLGVNHNNLKVARLPEASLKFQDSKHKLMSSEFPSVLHKLKSRLS
jgi:hypothetical protein